jgi:hypothetical protein
MTRFVALHKLTSGFKDWEFQRHYVANLDQTVPIMNDEFHEWYNENRELIKAVHQNKNFNMDRMDIFLEFYNEDEATICMLRFA